MIGEFLIDADARFSVFCAITEASKIFEFERRLTPVERETIISEKLTAARHDLDCYFRADADVAFGHAVAAVREEITATSIERTAARDRPEYVALSPAEGAELLIARRAGR